MVYPPALFEKGAGDAEKTSPLCTSDQSDPASPSFMENCDLDDFCEGFDGFMSLASDAREMAQEMGIRSPGADALYGLMEQAIAAGDGDRYTPVIRRVLTRKD